MNLQERMLDVMQHTSPTEKIPTLAIVLQGID